MDFYGILGLERSATAREIQRAYRRLARRYHPDVNPGDTKAEAIFSQVVEAYETLMDPDRRRRYDNREAEPRAVRPSYRFEGFSFSEGGIGPESTFGDLFADLFPRAGPSRERERPAPGVDLHVRLATSFDDVMRGGVGAVTVTRLVHCADCRGSGALPVPDTACPDCDGTGVVKRARGHMTFGRGCATCGGTGRQVSRVCAACRGEGVTARAERVKVVIPAGTADGARLRVPTQGHAGRRGGPAGDLYVSVDVAPHRFFRRQGDDLLLTVPVAVHEAALGARIEIPTLEGPVRLRIPPGTQSDQRFRLRGRGAPTGHDGRRGDLLALVRIVLPDLLDERSKELLREFGRIHTGNVRRSWGDLGEVV